MGTYDAYWDMRYQDNNSNSYASTYSSSSLTAVKAEEPERPITTAIIDKTEWVAAKNGLGTDFMIAVNDQCFLVHKVKLMINSEFFKKQFSLHSNTNEMRCDSIAELKNIDAKVIKILLKFIYLKAMSKKTQSEIRNGKLDLFIIVKKAQELGIKGISEWSAHLLASQFKKKPPTFQEYEDWFGLACQENSTPLYDVLLKETSEKKLIQAINRASMDALITKEVWGELKKKARIHGNFSVITNCETYNPIIGSMLRC